MSGRKAAPDEPARGAHPLEERPGGLESRLAVLVRDDAPLELLCGPGLAEVVTQRPKHQKQVATLVAPPELRRLIDDLARVNPDVTLRMPLGILGHVDQRLELRKEAQQRELA